MHEAGLVARALDRAFGPGAAPPQTGSVRLVIQDPLRVERTAVAYLAQVLLRERGIVEPRVEVVVALRRCDSCRSLGAPSPTDPCCDACGLPYRRLDGNPIVALDAGSR